jgi:hypothetical protein
MHRNLNKISAAVKFTNASMLSLLSLSQSKTRNACVFIVAHTQRHGSQIGCDPTDAWVPQAAPCRHGDVSVRQEDLVHGHYQTGCDPTDAWVPHDRRQLLAVPHYYRS